MKAAQRKPFLVLGTILGEAFAAVHGLVATGLEGNLGGAAATIADHFEHLAFATVVVAIGTTSGAASGAAAGFVLEALFGVESLFGSGEGEFLTAFTASQSLVLVHGVNPPNKFVCQTEEMIRSGSFRGLLRICRLTMNKSKRNT